jgi:hypothetical protein
VTTAPRLPDDATERAEALARDFLLPLARGGDVTLQRPFGAGLALRLGRQRVLADDEVRRALDAARLDAARALLPIDAVPDLDADDWALACALHDLLQATNPDLSSPLSHDRPFRLARGVRLVAERIRPPSTIAATIARHSLFHRLPQLGRLDTTVRWWSGEQRFLGVPPPPRLLAMPNLRRVRITSERIELERMGEGIPDGESPWLEALEAWLERTPLTNLTWARRAAPRFRWTPSSLAVVASTTGRDLVRRALAADRTGEVSTSIAALRGAADSLAQPHQRHVEAACDELERACALGLS